MHDHSMVDGTRYLNEFQIQRNNWNVTGIFVSYAEIRSTFKSTTINTNDITTTNAYVLLNEMVSPFH